MKVLLSFSSFSTCNENDISLNTGNFLLFFYIHQFFSIVVFIIFLCIFISQAAINE